ncbi:TIGR03086 family metal-binding protein [Streptomyces fuscigenes]|uniref:TIGR03086 family metal-binding protein n=1 Tax=Streptomyces fuscigenes TaxID=1528880 RepID=UPI001F2A3642|nr:TIGR03086 family metal-binding protein [Streptomyces fuscigenes]MCF3961056.1 TIGR03086 family metal-binding protein [Streptomyces fuscigenes]
MNEKISALLERAAAGTVPVVRGLDDAQLSLPTPCDDYDVRTLVGHLLLVVRNFRELAAKRDADFGRQSLPLEGDWREDFAREVRALVGAWAAPGAEEGTTGALGMPARTVGAMVLGDLVVHGWDLARASGRAYDGAAADAVLVTEVRDRFAELAPTARRMGMFAPEVPVGPDASTFDHLLGLTGRDPWWTPEVALGT